MVRSLITFLSIAILVSACCRGPKQFDDPDDHYSVSVPGSPMDDFINHDAGNNQYLSVFTWVTSSGGVEYNFGRGSVEGKSEGLTADDLEKITIDYLVTVHHGDLDKDEKIEVGGHSGREVIIIGKTRKTAARIVTIGDEFLYLQEITFRSDAYDQAEVDRYFDSWKFGPRAGKHPPELDIENIPDWLKEKK